MTPSLFAGLGRGRLAITGATTIGASHVGLVVDATSGTFSVAATAAATLGGQFQFCLYNSGSGTVTFNPDGSETIRLPDGTSVTTVALTQGQGYWFVCNGTGWVVALSAASGGISDGDKGDITVSSSGATWTIDAGAVTLAKMADLATDRLIGRDTAGSGAPEALTVGGGIEFTGSGGIQRSALTGDVTASAGSASTTIANDAVTNAKAANMAESTIKGRAVGAGTGDPTDLTATQATAILNAVVGDSGSGGTKGLVPAPAAGDAAANKFLKADGAWVTPAGGGDVSDGGTLSTGLTFPNTGLHILDTNASHDLIVAPGSNLTADHTLTLTTGDADRTLTISGDTTLGGGSHSGTNTGDQNLFSTIAVSGQSNVVADATSDTLTLVAGSNITITTDAGADSITIAASGGGGGTAASTAEIAAEDAVDEYIRPDRAKYGPWACKAWVNFTGTGTVTINDSYNVTSVTDNGTGDYTINFTNAMANANYAVVGNCQLDESGADAGVYLSVARAASAMTTTSVRVFTGTTSSKNDARRVFVAIFGDI